MRRSIASAGIVCVIMSLSSTELFAQFGGRKSIGGIGTTGPTRPTPMPAPAPNPPVSLPSSKDIRAVTGVLGTPIDVAGGKKPGTTGRRATKGVKAAGKKVRREVSHAVSGTAAWIGKGGADAWEYVKENPDKVLIVAAAVTVGYFACSDGCSILIASLSAEGGTSAAFAIATVGVAADDTRPREEPVPSAPGTATSDPVAGGLPTYKVFPRAYKDWDKLTDGEKIRKLTVLQRDLLKMNPLLSEMTPPRSIYSEGEKLAMEALFILGRMTPPKDDRGQPYSEAKDIAGDIGKALVMRDADALFSAMVGILGPAEMTDSSLDGYVHRRDLENTFRNYVALSQAAREAKIAKKDPTAFIADRYDRFRAIKSPPIRPEFRPAPMLPRPSPELAVPQPK